MSVKVTVDRMDAVLKSMRALTESKVVVGFPGSTSDRGEPLNNPTLAYIHEMGAPEANIPARPFLGPGVASIADDAAKIFGAGAKATLSGKASAAKQSMLKVGVLAQDAVQHKIETGPFVPLKPETIRRKGHDKPLIDTRAMRDAVTFEIRPTKS